LEQQLWSAHGVRAEFATLREISEEGRLADNDKKLMIKRSGTEYEVSVAYYRAGYTPDDYHSEVEWEARSMIEYSASIKCPNVGYHLTGTKAIQAALCKPGVLERYLEPIECEQLRKCFAQQFSLSDIETKEAANKAMEQAMEDGSGWVLKPQREGGGNNYYGEKLSAFLREHKNDPVLDGKYIYIYLFIYQ
jgi:glutathione synthase